MKLLHCTVLYVAGLQYYQLILEKARSGKRSGGKNYAKFNPGDRTRLYYCMAGLSADLGQGGEGEKINLKKTASSMININ